MFFFILITCLLDTAWILSEEILFWSLMGVKGLKGYAFQVLKASMIKSTLVNE